MRRVLLLLLVVVVTLVTGDVSVTGEKPSTEAHQNYQTYQYLAPTGYYNNNGYAQQNNNGYNAYYQQNHQKQDLFGGFGGGNGGGNDLFGGGGGDGGDIGGAIGAVLAALGLKGITKLGIAVALLFFFVIVPLFIIPGILSIIAIIVAAVQGTNGMDMGIMEKMKQMMGKNDDNANRALSTFYKFVNNEECIEKMSCVISQRAYSRNMRHKNVKVEHGADSMNKDKSETKTKSKGTMMSRIARAISADDCHVYSCSVMSYFS